jgi:hypothetical protein
MAGFLLEIDPTSEDAANVPLSLSDGTSFFPLEEIEAPIPELKSVWATSFDTEGDIPADEHQYENREITVNLRIRATSASLLRTALNKLGQKIGKLNREQGTLKLTLPNADVIVFDVVAAQGSGPAFRNSYGAHNRTEASVTFVCRPFGRGTLQTFSADTETTLPVLIFTETGVKGDVPGLGRLLVDEIQGVAQWTVRWGLRSRYYSASADQALFYQAESRTLLNSATSAAATGASGGNAVSLNAVGYFGLISTQASGGGNHLAHTGEYRVFARAQMQSADRRIALEWSVGDNSVINRNDPYVPSYDQLGDWFIADLGTINIPPVTTGTQRWQGRFVADASAGAAKIDCFWLIPTTEGYGEITGAWYYTYGSVLTGRDELNDASGGLNGTTADAGGNWATSGVATDWTYTGSGTVTRATTSEASPRYAILGTTNHTGSFAELEFSMSAAIQSNAVLGPLMRWTDASNHVRARFVSNSGNPQVAVERYIAGALQYLGIFNYGTVSNDQIMKLRMAISADGAGAVWLWPGGVFPDTGTPVLIGTFNDVSLATGGTLASGENGFFDWNNFSTANTRTIYSLYQGDIVSSPALHASQSLEVRHDRAIREDAAGAIWQPVPSYEGSYLRVPPAGQEARTTQIIVKGSRGLPTTYDTAIDDIRATLSVVPRYLSIPEA